MSSTISLEIPRDVLRSTRMSSDELRRELAVHLFEQKKLSFGKARELANLSAWDFLHLLGSRDVPMHYDEEAYEADLDTLRQLGRL
jgi:predicted HTH domain antitoxin